MSLYSKLPFFWLISWIPYFMSDFVIGWNAKSAWFSNSLLKNLYQPGPKYSCNYGLSCPWKETVDMDIFKKSRNGDGKIMQSIRITSGPPTRIKKRNQFSQFRWRSTKVMPIKRVKMATFWPRDKCSREAASIELTVLHIHFYRFCKFESEKQFQRFFQVLYLYCFPVKILKCLAHDFPSTVFKKACRVYLDISSIFHQILRNCHFFLSYVRFLIHY